VRKAIDVLPVEMTVYKASKPAQRADALYPLSVYVSCSVLSYGKSAANVRKIPFQSSEKQVYTRRRTVNG
jgi:hypothetical protein